MVLTRFLFRGLYHQPRFYIFFILNLAIGLSGLLTLRQLSSSLDQSIRLNSKSLLAADVAVSVRRVLTSDELEKIKAFLPSDAESSRYWEFAAMVTFRDRSRLVQVRAVEPSYPFYGKLETDTRADLSDSGVIVDEDLLREFELPLGESLVMDSLKFRNEGVVTKDSTRSLSFGSFAPRIYVSFKTIQNSHWIGKGATLSDHLLIRVKNEASAIEIQKKIQSILLDPAIHVSTADQTALDAVRFLGYVTDYSGLVSAVALLLAVVGCAYLVLQFFSSKQKETAILHSLGLGVVQTVLIYIAQLMVLAVFSSIIAFLISQTLAPLIVELVRPFSPVQIINTVDYSSFFFALGIAILTTVMIAAPAGIRHGFVRTQELLSDTPNFVAQSSWPWIWTLPAVFSYWLLCIKTSHSLKTGSVFYGSLVAAAALIIASNYIFLKILGRLKLSSPALLYANWNLTRSRGSLVVLSALCLGALLMSLIPQIQYSLQRGLQTPEAQKTPSFFMFDIQDEQLGQLKGFLEKENLELMNPSPLIRARILRVNDNPFERAADDPSAQREDQEDASFRNRGVNLSYREKLSENEMIYQGRPLTTTYDGKMAEISVEKRYAQRMGLKLNDRLVFDVQGVEIPAVVTNLRKVKWTSFQPNFFVLVQTGVLEEAPKIWIASLPPLSDEKARNLQTRLVKSFPNVSMIQLKNTVNKLIEIIEQISFALGSLSLLVMFCGIFVLAAIAQSQAQTRVKSHALLTLLGASSGWIQRTVFAESLAISVFAITQAVALSIVCGFLVIRFVFEEEYYLNLKMPLAIGGVAILISTITVYFFSTRFQKLPTRAALDLF